MKKFVMNLLGVVATASNIKGKKSNGTEDASSYKHWKKDPANSYDSIN